MQHLIHSGGCHSGAWQAFGGHFYPLVYQVHVLLITGMLLGIIHVVNML